MADPTVHIQVGAPDRECAHKVWEILKGAPLPRAELHRLEPIARIIAQHRDKQSRILGQKKERLRKVRADRFRQE